MSPFDLTNLAALKAWLGLAIRAGPERYDAHGACHSGESFGLRRPKPAKPAAALL